MVKKITLFTLAAIVVMGFMHGNGFAEPEDDLNGIQEKRENIKGELSEKEEKSKQFMSEINDLNEEVEEGNAAIAEKEELIEDTEQDIEDTIGDIHSLQDDIKDLETRIDERYDLLKDRLSSYQKSGGRVSYMDVVMGADNFEDFTSRVSLVTKITDSDVALMDQHEQDTKDVEAKQELTMKKLDELNSVKDEQENVLASIDEQRKENEARIETLGEKQETLSASKDELQLEDGDLATLEKRTENSIAASAKAEEEAEQQAEMEAKEKVEKEAELKAEAKSDEKPKQKEQAKKQTAKNNQDQKEKKVATKEKDEAKNNTDKSKDKSSEKASKPDKKSDKKPDSAKKPESDGESFTVTSTAYTATCAGCTGVTSTGIDLKEDPEGKKVIAVDPDVIPLGSVVNVEGYGTAIAGDTGGAINGKKIDVFVPTDEEATAWGVQTVKVTIE